MDDARQYSDEDLERKLQDRAAAQEGRLAVVEDDDPRQPWMASIGKVYGRGTTRRGALEELHRAVAQADVIGA
jgi:hypothetical protein